MQDDNRVGGAILVGVLVVMLILALFPATVKVHSFYVAPCADAFCVKANGDGLDPFVSRPMALRDAADLADKLNADLGPHAVKE